MPCFSASNRHISQPLTGKSVARAKTANVSSVHASNSRTTTNFGLKGKRLPFHCNATEGNSKKNHARTERIVSLPVRELNRLKTAAKVVTLEERLDALVLKEQEMKRLEEETEQAKRKFRKIDDDRKKAQQANVGEVEGEVANEQLKVLEKAFLAKQEQEEEVKKANRIILDAKCHAVREAQVQEKYELQRELLKENQRLEKQVIDSAIKALSEEDAKQERLSEEKEKYAKEIRKQLSERETARFLEAERIEEEALMLRKTNEIIKQDEEQQAKLARERRLKYRDDLAKVMEMSTLFRRMLCEQEKEAEMRVAAYVRAREERMKALQAEQKLAKEELDRKQQRIYNLAEKILQSKSDREEMSYLTEQERLEREYRRKEKEAVLRKKQFEREIAETRERQMQEMKHCQALQIAKEEQEFNILLKNLKEAEAKQKAEDEQRERRRKSYHRDIIQQMGDNEMKRRNLLELEKRQALAWRESERQRDANIRAVIKAKVNAMRDACLPEKYIKDVEKQLSRVVGQNNTPSKLV